MVSSTLLLNLPVNHSLFSKRGWFGSLLSISEIVVGGKNLPVPPGLFSNAQELGNLLESEGWSFQISDNQLKLTYQLCITSNNNKNQELNKDNYITFSDMTVLNFDLIHEHRKTINNRLEDPIQSSNRDIASGVINELSEIASNTDTDICQYTGVLDLGNQFDFLQDIQQKYYILTAFNTVSGVVGGPISFNSIGSYSQALAQLHIIVEDNLVTVLKSPHGDINKIFFLNSNMSIIASIDLEVSRCCPDLNGGKVLFQKGDQDSSISWLSMDCLEDALVSGGGTLLQRQICELPLGASIKCTVQLDASKPFLNNRPANFPFPWKVNSFILLGEDITNSFAGGMVSSFQDWADILSAMGWSLAKSNSSIYFFYKYSDENNDTNSSYSLIDNRGNLFFSDNLFAECLHLADGAIASGELEMIYKFPGQGDVVRGGVKPIFDQLPVSTGQTFSCVTTMLTLCVIKDLGEAEVGFPWHFSKIVISGQEQTVVGNNFSTRPQLETILINQMAWSKQTDGVFTLTTSLQAPNSQSYAEIEGSGGDKLVIDLPVLCTANCETDTAEGTNETHLVLTKSETGLYSWSAPSCLNGGGLTIDCNLGSTDLLGEINDCDVEPRYDLKFKLKSGLIDIINSHFSSNGPYWILAYKLSGGDVVSVEKRIGSSEDDVFSLRLLVECLISLDLGWQTSVPLNLIDDGSATDGLVTEVELTLFASPLLIHGMCLNLLGEVGNDIPFSYVIPITDICNVSCLGLGKLEDNKVLIRGPTGYCFVDLACILPIDKPEPDLDLALCQLPECGDAGETGSGGDFQFNTCLTLDICDVEKLRKSFGEANLVEIVGYQLVNGTIFYVNHNLGTINPDSETFLDQIIAAFINGEGWSSPDVNARPVELNKLMNVSVSYISFNIIGANPNIAPFPCLFPANCSSTISCPSIDPENMIMIKKPHGQVCWTPICPVAGPEGPAGENAVSLIIDSGTGASNEPTSGPIEIEADETLRVWSPGSILSSVSANAIRLDSNVLFFNGNGMTPEQNDILPGDPSKLAIYYNGTSVYLWNPDNQQWDLFGL